ncbi:transposase family protein [Streptomyces sp. NPDC059010]|uniref:transposase family protein n=1 Tax=Streptomyces sp. NPDC059010 TaxID=3346695 RepID=UPI0036934996
MVEAVAVGRPGRCPGCRKWATRVHSTYQRTLYERPLGSRRVVVPLRVRQYFCDRGNCSPRTFIERSLSALGRLSADAGCPASA